ncbi:hypothetical protein TYRP_012635 [Tyrophagus putrescentiae]|nr:hypothetical protein TYRP_012635 [Tyrophagus putrescentiae]
MAESFTETMASETMTDYQVVVVVVARQFSAPNQSDAAAAAVDDSITVICKTKDQTSSLARFYHCPLIVLAPNRPLFSPRTTRDHKTACLSQIRVPEATRTGTVTGGGGGGTGVNAKNCCHYGP